MPNSATLVQALGAAFCAILFALSGMGGGGMMIGARVGAWSMEDHFIGLDENWSTPFFDYEGLPFEYVGNCKTGTRWVESLSNVNRFFNSSNNDAYGGPFGVHKASYISGLGNRFYFTIRYGSDKNILSFMSQWDDELETIFKFSFDGSRFFLHFYENGSWVQKITTTSTQRVAADKIRFLKCANDGWSWDYPFAGATPGTFDLSRCYIVKNGKIWWEGVKGAYKNVNG